MAEKYLQGRTFYLLLSADNWTTTYTAVCLTRQGMDRQRNVSKVDTQCGMAKAFGSVDRVLNFEAVNNLTPAAVAAGVGEASYKKMAEWMEAETELKFRRKTPADGSELYQEGTCKIQSLGDAAEVGNNQTFTVVLEILGALDETP